MSQQINLVTPLLLVPKRYFSARAMLVALTSFMVLGAALATWVVRNVNRSSDTLAATMGQRSAEIAQLRQAVATAKVGTGKSVEQTQRELDQVSERLAARRQLLANMQHGVMSPGQGYSARLQWVAQTIPPVAWLTELRLDTDAIEVQGYTLEPAALNGWVAALARSPLLQGQQLMRIKVEDARVSATSASAGTAIVPDRRQAWAYSLTSAIPTPARPEGVTR